MWPLSVPGSFIKSTWHGIIACVTVTIWFPRFCHLILPLCWKGTKSSKKRTKRASEWDFSLPVVSSFFAEICRVITADFEMDKVKNLSTTQFRTWLPKSTWTLRFTLKLTFRFLLLLFRKNKTTLRCFYFIHPLFNGQLKAGMQRSISSRVHLAVLHFQLKAPPPAFWVGQLMHFIKRAWYNLFDFWKKGVKTLIFHFTWPQQAMWQAWRAVCGHHDMETFDNTLSCVWDGQTAR